MKTVSGSLLAAALAMAMGLSPAMGDENTDKARVVFNKYKDSTAWVTAVVDMELSASGKSLGGARESKVQCLGTLIDASGLFVCAYSALDPAFNVRGSMADVGGGQKVKVSATSKQSQVKIILANGTELDAKIVLTDEELDLAFIMPEKPAKLDMPVVTMEKNPKLEVLDLLVCLGRMPKGMDDVPAVATSEINSVITKPRQFYTGGRTLGGPVFTLDGTPAGMTTAYKTEIEGNSTVSLVIIPAEVVAKSAKEALSKKSEPTTKEAP